MTNSIELINSLHILQQLDLLDRLSSKEDDTNASNEFQTNNYQTSHSCNKVISTLYHQKDDTVAFPKNSHHLFCTVPHYLPDAENPLEDLSDDQFLRTYAFRKQTVLDLYRMIDYGLNYGTRRGLPKCPMKALLLTLQYLVFGAVPRQALLRGPFSQSTTSRLLKKITGLLSELRPRFIKMPEANRACVIAEKFQHIGGFPNVFACIGSAHVAIKTPPKAVADDYLNENGFHSVRFVASTGPDLQFYEVITRWPGASHENKIFNLSEIYQRFEFTTKMDGLVLLANERYSCTNFVMTPIDIASGCVGNEMEKYLRYNEAHFSTYSFYDTINLWKRRFRCLQTVLGYHDETVQSIIIACAVLHNIAIQRNEPKLSPGDNVNDNREIINKDINFRRQMPILTQLQQDPRGIMKRNEIISMYFT